MEEKKLRTQGARCMDCGIPFCHTGKLISGMASGCPINNLIPEWNDLVYRGLWRRRSTACTRPTTSPSSPAASARRRAKGSCVLGINEPAGHDQEHRVRHHRPRLGRGLGHARGAAGAHRQEGRRHRLRPRRPGRRRAAQPRRPHRHRLRARRPPGGLLMYGIPNMKLDKQEVVLRRIKLLERRASSSSATPTSATTSSPRSSSRNSTPPSSAPAPPAARPAHRGPRAQGRPLRHGVPHGQHQGRAQRRASNGHDLAAGKDVVVIGGGDTGTDCVGTSLRHGCKSLVQIEILPKPPLERAADNPWPEWPKTYKMDYGQEEAAAKFGADPRIYLTTT
jgi:glutamate synthase (NADPH/NADH) small chain